MTNEKQEILNEKRKMTNENEQFKKNNIVKDANVKKLTATNLITRIK